MSKLNWDRPKYRTEGRETEDARGFVDRVPGRRRRSRPKRRKTMLSDGTLVDGALSSEQVAELEAKIGKGNDDLEP